MSCREHPSRNLACQAGDRSTTEEDGINDDDDDDEREADVGEISAGSAGCAFKFKAAAVGRDEEF